MQFQKGVVYVKLFLSDKEKKNKDAKKYRDINERTHMVMDVKNMK